tara:strand:- start:3613 stop:3987 length:375 start_codon:yes stop_codon:yes gene_type:complete
MSDHDAFLKTLANDVKTAIDVGGAFTLDRATEYAKLALSHVETIADLSGEEKRGLVASVLIMLATEAAAKTETQFDDFMVETVGVPLIKSIVDELLAVDAHGKLRAPEECSCVCAKRVAASLCQ